MPSVHEQLRAVGIALIPHDEYPELHAESARLARLLAERHVRTLGVIPADDDVALPAVALELGRAITERGALVAVVDALGRWPCSDALLQAEDRGAEPFVKSWVLENMAVLTPRMRDAPSTVALAMETTLDKTNGFNRLILDLTGFDHLGEDLAACALLDAAILVARSGRTTARRIERWYLEHPEVRCLGVLLTGL